MTTDKNDHGLTEAQVSQIRADLARDYAAYAAHKGHSAPSPFDLLPDQDNDEDFGCY